jgi:hypothetical protein
MSKDKQKILQEVINDRNFNKFISEYDSISSQKEIKNHRK